MVEATGPQQPPTHDLALPYCDEIVPGAALALDRWDWWSNTDRATTDYYAKGPCPACHADTQGHYALVKQPIEQQQRQQQEPEFRRPEVHDRTIDMPLQCRCGTEHGKLGAKGCGRRWSIIGPRAGSRPT